MAPKKILTFDQKVILREEEIERNSTVEMQSYLQAMSSIKNEEKLHKIKMNRLKTFILNKKGLAVC